MTVQIKTEDMMSDEEIDMMLRNSFDSYNGSNVCSVKEAFERARLAVESRVSDRT